MSESIMSESATLESAKFESEKPASSAKTAAKSVPGNSMSEAAGVRMTKHGAIAIDHAEKNKRGRY